MPNIQEEKLKEFQEKVWTLNILGDGNKIGALQERIESWLKDTFHTIDEQGYERGYKKGYKHGEDLLTSRKGNQLSFQAGKKEGYNEGYEVGMRAGYESNPYFEKKVQEEIQQAIEQTRKDVVAAIKPVLDKPIEMKKEGDSELFTIHHNSYALGYNTAIGNINRILFPPELGSVATPTSNSQTLHKQD
jgi:hypothetical protein